MKSIGKIRKVAAALFATCTLSLSVIAQASPHGGGPTTITGVVYKQGLVVDQVDGETRGMFAVYKRDTGDVVTWLDYDASDPAYWITSGAAYAANNESYQTFRQSLSAEQLSKMMVVSRDEFDVLSYPAEYAQFKGQPFPDTRSLLVYKPTALDSTLQLDSSNGLIVYQSRFALEADGLIARNSLLMDGNGEIVYSSNDNIGYRVAFITPEGFQDTQERSAEYEPGDTLVSPVTYGSVSTGLNPVANFSIDESGRYQALSYMPPCPGLVVDFLVPVTATIPYTTYNPQRPGGQNQYFFSSYSNYFCAGAPFYSPSPFIGQSLDYLNAQEIYASLQAQPPQAHFQIDVTLLRHCK